MGKKKQFISKNESQHYHLVFKSNQEQPLPTVEGSQNENQANNSDKVLLPVNKKKNNNRSGDPDKSYPDSAIQSGLMSRVGEREEDDEDKYEKLHKKYRYRVNEFDYGEFGFPDDGYDYTQHFSDMGRGVFISAILEESSKVKNDKNLKNTDFQFKNESQLPSQETKTSEKNQEKIEVEVQREEENEERERENQEKEEIKKLKKIDIEIYDQLFPEKERKKRVRDHKDDIKREKKREKETEEEKEEEEEILEETIIEGDLQDDFVLEAEDVGDEINEEDTYYEDQHFDVTTINQRLKEIQLGRRGKTILDDQFDLIEKEYNDSEIGDLEGDQRVRKRKENEGSDLDDEEFIDHNDDDNILLAQIISEYENKNRQRQFDDNDEDEEDLPDLEPLPDDEIEQQEQQYEQDKNEQDEEELDRKIAIQKVKEKYLKDDRDESDEIEDTDDDDDMEDFEEKEEEEWDCQSILSTYSNVSNHPSVIVEESSKRKKPLPQQIIDKDQQIQLSKKSGIPLNTLPKQKPPKQKIKNENQGQKRNKEESQEEKVQRKKAMKQQKQANRTRKKNLKLAFKEEKKNIVSPNPSNQKILPLGAL